MSNKKPYKLQNFNNDSHKYNIELSSPYFTSRQLKLIYYTQLLLGIGFVISSIYFNRLQCNFFCFQTNQEFAAICVYIFFYPLGFMLILDSISKIAASNIIPMVAKSIILTFMGFISIIIPIYLFLPQHWNGSQYFKLYRIPPMNKYLNTYTLSFEIFVLWIPFGILFLLMTYRLFKNEKRKIKNLNNRPNARHIQQKLCYVMYTKYIYNNNNKQQNTIYTHK